MPRARLATSMLIAALAILSSSVTAASAENNPAITYPTGTLLSVFPEAPKLLGTAVGISLITANNQTLYQCTPFKTTGSLEKNTGSLFELTLSSVSLGTCQNGMGQGLTVSTSQGNGTPWCLRSTPSMADDEFQIRGNSCNKESRSITIVLGCNFERTAPISGSFTTDAVSQDAILTLSSVEFTKEANQPFCPPATSLDIVFTLELDTTTTADPIYIS